MRIYVVGSSALHFWRRVPNAERLIENHCAVPLAECAQSPEELQRIAIPQNAFGKAPIHLMVPSPDLRLNRKDYWYSVLSKDLPQNSFCVLNSGICIASPEMCLLGALRYISDVRVLELCMELCGRYTLVHEAERGYISNRKPLTSTDKIRSFAETMRGVRGSAPLLRLLSFAENGSRSPMETRQYLFMCLPKRFGGYGLPRPFLNYPIDITTSQQKYTERDYLECDMVWPDKHVVVEYDGHDDHESRENRARDAVKRNVLVSQGNSIFTVTGKQICQTDVFDEIVREIAQAIGYRLRAFPENWKDRRAALRGELFKTMSQYEIERFF